MTKGHRPTKERRAREKERLVRKIPPQVKVWPDELVEYSHLSPLDHLLKWHRFFF